MARLRRLYAPNVPQLAQARLARPLASPSDPTPAAALDQIRDWLIAEARLQQIAVHGWALLPDQLVLLATSPTPTGLSRVIQGVGRRMATRVTLGRVFEGRYRSGLIDDAWVVPCLIWAESLAVAGGYVDSAVRWPWSSAQEHVGLRSDGGWMADHQQYWGLGNTPYARQARYQDSLSSGVGQSDSARIEQALFGQWALGDDEFVLRLASRSTRRVAPAPRGRPRKTAEESVVTN